MTLWKIGSRWNDTGTPGNSVQNMFNRHQIVFVGSNQDLFRQIQVSDLLAITDGTLVVAIGEATSLPQPITKMDMPLNFPTDDEVAKYYRSEVWGCKAHILFLKEEDRFQAFDEKKGRRGSVFRLPHKRDRVQTLWKTYCTETEIKPRNQIMNPNLFHFATSELSQDAVLCWLLSWADTKYEKSPLHGIGLALLKLIYARADMKTPEAISIAVKKQQKHIDILCVVNTELAIVIEDKTGTKQHSGQLDRYRAHVTNELGYSPQNIIFAYIQTGDQGDYSPVIKSGYIRISRVDLLTIFEDEPARVAKEQSDIFRDFSAHLRRIEDDVRSYRTSPLSAWSWEAWKGFYSKLQEEMRDGHWDYVANPSGGFLGFWWYFGGDDAFNIYLQLEHEKLCFKIWVKDAKKRSELRQHWHDKIMAAGKAHNLPVKRPSRFGLGEYMTVAVLATDYRITGDDGLIDMGKTLALFQSAQAVIDDCLKV